MLSSNTQCLAGLLALGVFVSGCVSNIKPFEQAGEIGQLTEAEKRYWYQAEQARKNLYNADLINRDGALEAYLNDIAAKLYPEYAEHVHVYVLNNPSYNAFAMPNGDIYINSAMLGALQNEAQIAIIVSHEIAHFVEKHGAISTDKLQNGMSSGAVLNSILPLVGLLGQGAAISSMYGLSRDHEREADRIGYEHYIRAGYPADQTLAAFRLLRDESTLNRDEEESYFFSSHPKLEERIASFNKLIAEQGDQSLQQNNAREIQYQQATASVAQGLPGMLYEFGRYDQLQRLLDSPKRTVPNADYFRAMVHLKQGEKDKGEAIPLLQQAIKDAPEFAASYRELGYLFAETQQPKAARDMLSLYLTKSPESLDKWFVMEKIEKLNMELNENEIR